MTYRGILPSTDLSLQSISGGVKEDIILNSASAPTSFLFPLTLQGLAASVTPQGEVAYTDATGTVRAITPQGYMQDSADPLHKVGAVSQGVTYTLVPSSTGGQALQVSLDSAWIRNPARVFPIVVDPTTQDYYTGQDDTYVMSGFTRDNASDTVLKLGTYDGGANVAIDFMNFPSINTSIPTNASISAASLGVYNNWSWSCTPEDVNVYQVTSGWAGHGLQSYPGANLGALLGTQSFADGYTGCANGPNWANFNVASTVQGWVNGTITNDGLAMAVDANQQTNNYAWKTFYSYDTCNGSCGVPQLQVTWSVPPSPPQNVQATPVASTPGALWVSWSPPANLGSGGQISDYFVDVWNGSTYTGMYVDHASSPTEFSGLSVGTYYTFIVYAFTPSDGYSYTYAYQYAPTYPGAPTNVVASVAYGTGALTVTWAPGPNGYSPLTGNLIYACTSTSSCPGYAPVGAGATSATIGGLTPGTQYFFWLIPYNGVGTASAWGGSAWITAATPPSAPLNVSAVENGSVPTVSWSAPTSNGYSPVSWYDVYVYNASNAFVTAQAVCGAPCPNPPTSLAVTGLQAGVSYSFTVYAYNAAGWSAPSAHSNMVPGIPSTPAPPVVTVPLLPIVTPAIPVFDGGSAITSYTIQARDVATTAVTNTVCASLCVASTLSGLTYGVTYTFTEIATNAYGSSATSTASAPLEILPATLPAPANVSALPGNTTATVTWTPGFSLLGLGGLTNSTIYAYTTASVVPVQTVSAGQATSAVVTGLVNGTPVTFTVATSLLGLVTSPQSAPSIRVTPFGPPGAPGAPVATAGDTNATVTWTPPNNGGSPITGYTVTTYRAADNSVLRKVTSTGSPVIVSQLTNGTPLYFSVHATNAWGDGPESAQTTSITPVGAPFPPTSPLATAGNTQAVVQWNPPGVQPDGTPGNNGDPIGSYTVIAQPGGATTSVPGNMTTATITSLKNGTTYTFTVIATNGRGPSQPSSATQGVIPSGPPFAVTNFTARAGDTKAIVSWNPPTSQPDGTPGNNGSPILTYSALAIQPPCSSCSQIAINVPGQTGGEELMTGLTNNVQYTLSMRATNIDGPGVVATATVTPGAPVASMMGLGDSYSSGEGNPTFVDSTSCDRSIVTNYPELAAANLGITSANYACSGAEPQVIASVSQTVEVTANDDHNGPFTQVPLQVTHLDGREDYLALTTGPDGFDCGQSLPCDFGSVLTRCVNIPLENPNPTPCQPAFDAAPTYTVTNAINQMGPVLTSTFLSLHQAAPTAQIFVLGYPTLFAGAGTCSYIRGSDVTWLEQKQIQFNQVEAAAVTEAAQQAGGFIHFVDLSSASAGSSPFIGHELCSGGTEWFYGIDGDAGFLSGFPKRFYFHPTADGQAAMAGALTRAIQNTPLP